MRRSLHAQQGVMFLSFLLLVCSAVAATFWIIKTQRADAAVINLAGRQRMLTQQITRLALTQPDSPELADAIERFEQTQKALLGGGETMDARGRLVELPATDNIEIRTRLLEVNQSWDSLQQHLQTSTDGELLANSAASILTELDELVSAFEAEANLKVVRLQQLQLAFLAAAFLLLGWSYLFTRRRIIQPLGALSEAAGRIGRGHFAQPVEALGGDEIGRLADTFELMRTEIAAAQALLEQRVSQRTQELTTAFEFSQEIVSRLELDQLLESVTNRARALMNAESAALCLLTADGEFLELVSSNNNLTDFRGMRQPVGNTLPLKVIGDQKIALLSAGCTDCGFLHSQAKGLCAAVPIRIGDQSLGALCVLRSNDEPFTEDDTRAITLLANAAAIAISNARLVEARQNQAEENAALLEREKLAADVHDSLAQTLGFLNLKSERTESLIVAGQIGEGLTELDHIRSTAKAAYRQVRAALTGLRKPPEEVELLQELQRCLKEFRNQTMITADLSMEDPSLLDLDPIIQKQVVHIVREALINIRRHAQATCVQLSVKGMNGRVRFTILDDGQGFDPETVNTDDHLGLAIMKSRAERSNGRLVIHSAPRAGTRIEVTFPHKSS